VGGDSIVDKYGGVCADFFSPFLRSSSSRSYEFRNRLVPAVVGMCFLGRRDPFFLPPYSGIKVTVSRREVDRPI